MELPAAGATELPAELDGGTGSALVGATGTLGTETLGTEAPPVCVTAPAVELVFPTVELTTGATVSAAPRAVVTATCSICPAAGVGAATVTVVGGLVDGVAIGAGADAAGAETGGCGVGAFVAGCGEAAGSAWLTGATAC